MTGRRHYSHTPRNTEALIKSNVKNALVISKQGHRHSCPKRAPRKYKPVSETSAKLSSPASSYRFLI